MIGDVDGDGREEIVTVLNDIANGGFDQKLVAIRRDGSIARSWQITGMNGYDLNTWPVPSIGEFNQDGITDIAVSYDGWGKADVAPGIVTILSTGAPYRPSAIDWPLIWHDAQGTAVLTANPANNPPTATLSSAIIVFAAQDIGTSSSPTAVILGNSGDQAHNISGIAITGTNAGDFHQTNTCPGSLAAGTSCTISVTFTPSEGGTRTGTLTITDNHNGVAGATQTVL